MDQHLPLCRVFFASLRDPTTCRPEEPLERGLLGVWQTGREAWPDLPLDAETLAAHLGRLVPKGTADARAFLRELVAPDLYLACACSQGDAQAMAALDRTYLSRVPAYVSHIDSAPAFGDEVRQVLRERLLCPREGAPPRIAEYSGRGALASWLRVSAVRTARNQRRNLDDRHTPVREEAWQQLSADEDPELDFLKTRYQTEFKAALRDAFTTLSAEQRNLLHLSLVGGRSTPEIGRLFGVNHSTVVRWLARARERIFDETRRLLRERLGVSDSEFQSLARLVRSQLDISIQGLLREQPTPAA